MRDSMLSRALDDGRSERRTTHVVDDGEGVGFEEDSLRNRHLLNLWCSLLYQMDTVAAATVCWTPDGLHEVPSSHVK